MNDVDVVLRNCIPDFRSIPHYRLKYFNCVAQVISVLTTERNSTVIRIWDGFNHEFQARDKMFVAEFMMIRSVEVPPLDELRLVTRDSFVDVILYGEWATEAITLKSGDVIVLSNVHVSLPRTAHQFTFVLHNGSSGAYRRGIHKLPEGYPERDHLNNRISEVLDDWTQRGRTALEYPVTDAPILAQPAFSATEVAVPQADPVPAANPQQPEVQVQTSADKTSTSKYRSPCKSEAPLVTVARPVITTGPIDVASTSTRIGSGWVSETTARPAKNSNIISAQIERHIIQKRAVDSSCHFNIRPLVEDVERPTIEQKPPFSRHDFRPHVEDNEEYPPLPADHWSNFLDSSDSGSSLFDGEGGMDGPDDNIAPGSPVYGIRPLDAVDDSWLQPATSIPERKSDAVEAKEKTAPTQKNVRFDLDGPARARTSKRTTSLTAQGVGIAKSTDSLMLPGVVSSPSRRVAEENRDAGYALRSLTTNSKRLHAEEQETKPDVISPRAKRRSVTVRSPKS